MYIANDGDTLRKIANQNSFDLDELISLNPHISGTDVNISRIQVKFPSSNVVSANQSNLDLCPPPVVEYIREWIPLTPLEQMEETEYDVLVVGTGAGGGAVLWRLCEQWGQNCKNIGVIEAGNLVLPTQARNIPTMNSERLDYYFRTVSKPLTGAIPDYPGARQVLALGGRTLFWNMHSPRLNLSEIPEWPVPIQEMDIYYQIAERVMNVTKQYPEGSSFTGILLDRLQRNGYPETTELPIAANLGPSVYGQIGTDVYFSTIEFLAEAFDRRTIDLAINTRAVQVLTHQGHVTGVKVMSSNKKVYVLKAKTVVLSASTFETPRLLLHSGIQGRAVGHFLTNHSFIKATGMVSRSDFPGVLGTLAVSVPETEGRPYEVHLTGPDGFYWYQPYEERPWTPELEILFTCFGKVEPRYQNRITLDPSRKDAYGVPEIQVHFSFSEQDLAIIRRLEEAVERLASTAGIRLVSQDGMPAICLQPAGDLNHDSGTCRMGTDPMTSVANTYGQIHGVSGLYVADNSVLPFIGATNLTLTTVALAIRTADHIIRRGGTI